MALLLVTLAACGLVAAHHAPTPAPPATATTPALPTVCQQAQRLGQTIAADAFVATSGAGFPASATLLSWIRQLDQLENAAHHARSSVPAADIKAVNAAAAKIDAQIDPAILPGSGGATRPVASVDWTAVVTDGHALQTACPS